MSRSLVSFLGLVGDHARDGTTVIAVHDVRPRPAQIEPIQQIGFVGKVDDQVCGVGYYN
jgi:hypothetical protein